MSEGWTRETAYRVAWLSGATNQPDIMPRDVAALPGLAQAWRDGYAEGRAGAAPGPLIPSWYREP